MSFWDKLKEKFHSIMGGTKSSTVEWDGKDDPLHGRVFLDPELGRYLLGSDKKIYTPLGSSGYTRSKTYLPKETSGVIDKIDIAEVTGNAAAAEIVPAGSLIDLISITNVGSASGDIVLYDGDPGSTGKVFYRSNANANRNVPYIAPSDSIGIPGPIWASAPTLNADYNVCFVNLEVPSW